MSITKFGIIASRKKRNIIPGNIAPSVNAGVNQSILLPVNTVNVTGTASDPDGTIVAYNWSKVSGPTTFSIVSPTFPTTKIDNLVQGTYIFRLTVTDNKGSVSSDDITIIVAPAINQVPVVNAGVNQIITLPTDSVTLVGSATDADGTIASYLWTKVSGGAATITSPTLATTTVTGLVAGTYIFQLQATDNLGGVGVKTMSVTVNAAPPVNQIPTANAGADKSITLPTNFVGLSGSGTDGDGTIVSYLWTKLSGGAALIVSPNSAFTNITGLAVGTYVFQLLVTDNLGSTDTDTVVVTVNPAPNLAPIAEAGANTSIKLPTSSLTLGGSGTDSDGTVVSYLWTKISGPATFNIVSPASAITVVNNLVEGTYVFQLLVTDNLGATGVDTVQVIVNPADLPAPTITAAIALSSAPTVPVSNASIVLPSNLSLVSASTATVGIATYLWEKVSGGVATISTPNNSATTITGLAVGTYVFKLTVWTIAPWNISSTTNITVTVTSTTTPTFYVKNGGNDAADGRSDANAWATHTKVSAAMLDGTIQPGNSVLYRRGDTFTGSLLINRSGTLADRIVIGAYGSGAKPIFSGFTTIASWVSLGSNLWESSSAISSLSTLNMVTVNGINTAMGRLPKSGYYIPTAVSNTSITDTVAGHLNTRDWTGAEVVVRTARWHLDRNPILSDSGTTITFALFGNNYNPYPESGYFLQNHIGTLTQQNDWYYNPTTKKLSLYHVGPSSPVNIKAAIVERLVDMGTRDYITFDNIFFEGANSYGVDLKTRSYVIVQNCDFNFIGVDGVYGYNNSPNCSVLSCTYSEINNIGINMGSSSNAKVIDCSTYNTGNLPGMGKSGDDSYTGIVSHGDNGLIQYNSVNRAGYCGIKWDGDATIVDSNFVDYTTYIKDDGGGIYCYPQQTGPNATVTYVTRNVKNNIVINIIGAIEGGAFSSDYTEAMGIYNDGTSPNTIYKDNTVLNSYYGIFSNAGHDNTIDGNTVYNCVRGLHYNNYGGFGIANLTVKNNTLVSATTNNGTCGNGQYPIYYEPGASAMPPSFSASNNCIARPLDETNGWVWRDFNNGNICSTLAAWKVVSGQDAGSTSSPIIVSNISKIRVEYNRTKAPISVNLGSTVYKNIKDGSNKTGTIVLQPFTSIILLSTL